MRASVSEQEELFLNMDLGEASPIWDRARLSTDIREDLAELEDNYDMILDNCQKVCLAYQMSIENFLMIWTF